MNICISEDENGTMEKFRNQCHFCVLFKIFHSRGGKSVVERMGRGDINKQKKQLTDEHDSKIQPQLSSLLNYFV